MDGRRIAEVLVVAPAAEDEGPEAGGRGREAGDS